MKRITTVFFMIFVLFLSISSYNSISFAGNTEGTDASGAVTPTNKTKSQPEPTKTEGISDIFSGGDTFVGSGESKVDASNLKDFSNTMANALIGVGTAIAVIYSVVLGIKFMIGSMEEKAEIKESLIPFIIGCAVLYGAFTIWKIVVNIGNKL